MIAERTPAFWRITLALCLGSFITFSNVYITQPLFPILKSYFGITSLQANWSLAIVTFMLALSLMIYGALSDVFGRRRIMLLTLVGVVITTFALAYVPDYTSLVVLRGLQGLFLGGVPAIALAYMSDELDQRALMVAVGIYISANSLGGISGRLFSGLIAQHFDWRLSFLSAAVLSLVCLLVFWWALPPSRHFQPRTSGIGSMLSGLAGHLRNQKLWPVYIIGGLNFFVFINLYSYVTHLLSGNPWYLGSGVLGMLYLTYLTGTWAASISGRVALRLGQPRVLMLGILILMSGSLLTLVPSLWTVFAGLLINSFGFFLSHSTASSWVSRQAEGAKASASSLYLMFYYLGASTGGFYLDIFWQAAAWPGVIGGGMLVLLVTLGLSSWLGWRYPDRLPG